MFFIIIALVSLIIVAIVLTATRVHGVFRLENECVHFTVSWISIQIMKREYRVGRDENRVVALYRMLKTREEKVTTLTEVLFTEKPDRDASLLKLIQAAIQSRKERKQVSPWFGILKRSWVDLRLNIEVGTGDAFVTAMACGLLITVGSAVCAAISTKRENYRLFVQPAFSRLSFSIRGDCIIDIAPANIILGYFIYKFKSRGKEHASD